MSTDTTPRIITKSKLPYSGNTLFSDLIDYLADVEIDLECPFKARIIIDAMKCWSQELREGNFICTPESLLSEIQAYLLRFYQVLAEDKKLNKNEQDKYWRLSGFEIFKNMGSKQIK